MQHDHPAVFPTVSTIWPALVFEDKLELISSQSLVNTCLSQFLAELNSSFSWSHKLVVKDGVFGLTTRLKQRASPSRVTVIETAAFIVS